MGNRKLSQEQEKSFIEEITLCGKDLFKMALYFTKNVDDAEDLTQETLIRAYTYFDSFKQSTNFKAWSLKIMQNIFYTNVKKVTTIKNKMSQLQLEMLCRQDVENEEGRTDIDGENTEKTKTIQDVLLFLLKSPSHKKDIEIIIWYYFKNKKIKEISTRFLIPIGSVKSRMNRIKEIIKKQIKITSGSI